MITPVLILLCLWPKESCGCGKLCDCDSLNARISELETIIARGRRAIEDQAEKDLLAVMDPEDREKYGLKLRRIPYGRRVPKE